MKNFTVTNVETVAFDDQVITLKSVDKTIKLHLHDQDEFDSFKQGDELSVEVTPAKKVSKKK